MSGGATLAAYMLVNNIYDLQNIQNNLSGTYALGASIDASASASWNGSAGFVPIGNFNPYTNTGASFTGTFNGNGSTISTPVIDLPSTNSVGVGLFSSVGGGGLVENLGLLGESVTASGLPSGLGPAGVGSLVGINFGTMTNAYATGTVSGPSNIVVGELIEINEGSVSNVHTSGTVTGSNGVGGLVGATAQIGTSSMVTDSYSSATVTANVSGATEIGGLIGHNGTGTVTQSYATGAVTVGSNSLQVAGLIGRNDGTVAKSYATGSVTAGASAGTKSRRSDRKQPRAGVPDLCNRRHECRQWFCRCRELDRLQ